MSSPVNSRAWGLVVWRECFGERHVEVVERAHPEMVAGQSGEHVGVAGGVQDSLEDDVVAVVKAVPGGAADQPDVDPARDVAFFEHQPPRHVLRHDRSSTSCPSWSASCPSVSTTA